jgi:hypothetical protein
MFVSGVNDTGDTAEQLIAGVKMTLVIKIHVPNGILGGPGDPDS